MSTFAAPRRTLRTEFTVRRVARRAQEQEDDGVEECVGGVFGAAAAAAAAGAAGAAPSSRGVVPRVQGTAPRAALPAVPALPALPAPGAPQTQIAGSSAISAALDTSDAAEPVFVEPPPLPLPADVDHTDVLLGKFLEHARQSNPDPLQDYQKDPEKLVVDVMTFVQRDAAAQEALGVFVILPTAKLVAYVVACRVVCRAVRLDATRDGLLALYDAGKTLTQNVNAMLKRVKMILKQKTSTPDDFEAVEASVQQMVEKTIQANIKEEEGRE
jgi:hypothetical protein